MKKSITTLFIILFFYTIGLTQRWTQMVEPAVDRGYNIANVEGVLWAAMGGGVYTSSDQGVSWQREDIVRYDYHIERLEYLDGEILMSVAECNYQTDIFRHFLYISKNQGKDWEIKETPLSGVFSSGLYKINQTYIVTGTGYFRSSDGGETWEDIEVESRLNIQSMDCTDKYMVVVLANKKILKSEDTGKSWVEIGAQKGDFVSVVDEFIFVDGSDFNLFYTKDNGVNWKSHNLEAERRNVINEVVRGKNGRLYFIANDDYTAYSTDNATTVFLLDDFNGIADLVELENKNLVGVGNDGFFSGDFANKSSWTYSGNNYLGLTPSSFFFLDNNDLFTGSANELFYYNANTDHWEVDTISRSFWGHREYTVRNDSIWYLRSNTLHLSIDGGLTGQPIAEKLPFSGLRHDFNIVDNDIFLMSKNILHTVNNQSSVWDTVRVFGDDELSIKDAIITEASIVVLTTDQIIYTSVDKGQTWKSNVSQYLDFHFGGDVIWELDGRLFITGKQRWFYSDDHGLNWTTYVPFGAPTVDGRYAAMTAVTQLDSTLYATFWTLGVYKSEDNGLTWSSFNAGLPELYTDHIVTHPDGFLVMGSSNGGIWKNDLMTSTEELNLINSSFAEKSA